MEHINFILKKNNEILIKESKLKCINDNNKIHFIINNIKYTYFNNILTKESNDEKIILDFIKKECTLLLLDSNYVLNLNISVNNIEETDKFISINYSIESEENIENIIILEYE